MKQNYEYRFENRWMFYWFLWIAIPVALIIVVHLITHS